MSDLIQRLRFIGVRHTQVSRDWEPYETVSHPIPPPAIQTEAADEIERLNQCLQYEQHRSGRMGTHGPGCHTWGPGHYECAMAVLERRTELLREARESSVWGYGHLGYLPMLARIDEELEAPPSNVAIKRGPTA